LNGATEAEQTSMQVVPNKSSTQASSWVVDCITMEGVLEEALKKGGSPSSHKKERSIETTINKSFALRVG
jgi:hypothetical protein